MKTKKENSKNFRKNNDGTDLRRLPLLPPGVHGEGEAGPNSQGEGEGQRLASQCLAKIQTLGRKFCIFFTH